MNYIYSFNVTEQEYKERLTVREFVRMQGVSLTEWRRIKMQAIIKLNGQQLEQLPYLYLNDTLEIELPQTENKNLSPEVGFLKILFEDEHLLIVSKPSGMLVHPTVDNLSGTLGNLVMGHYKARGDTCGFKPVMRLDRQTSGIAIIAKSARVQHLLSSAPLRKIYLALMPEPGFEEMDVVKPIARKLPSIIEREVNEECGQYAHTYFKVLRRYGAIALVQAELFTGRTHQIRVHAAYLQLPLLGDDLYGGDIGLIARQALHAHCVEFKHPLTGEPLKIIDELPKELEKCLNLSK